MKNEQRIWNKSELEKMDEWVEDTYGDWQHSHKRCWITENYLGKPIKEVIDNGHPVFDEMIAKPTMEVKLDCAPFDKETELVQEAVTQMGDKLKERLDKGEIGITLENGTTLKVGGKYTSKNWDKGALIHIIHIGKEYLFVHDQDGQEGSYPISQSLIPYTEPKEEPKPLETWTKTMDLRYIEIDTFLRRLQQKHISNLGNEKWVDIETVVL